MNADGDAISLQFILQRVARLDAQRFTDFPRDCRLSLSGHSGMRHDAFLAFSKVPYLCDYALLPSAGQGGRRRVRIDEGKNPVASERLGWASRCASELPDCLQLFGRADVSVFRDEGAAMSQCRGSNQAVTRIMGISFRPLICQDGYFCRDRLYRCPGADAFDESLNRSGKRQSTV